MDLHVHDVRDEQLGDDDDEDSLVGDDEPFTEVYDRAVARVVACRQRKANKEAQHKLAKDELAVACAQLEALRKRRTEPQQRALPGLSRS